MFHGGKGKDMYHCQHVSVEIYLRKHTAAQRCDNGSVKCAIPYTLNRRGRRWGPVEERNNKVASLPAQSDCREGRKSAEESSCCFFFFTNYIPILSLTPRARQYVPQDGLLLTPRLFRHGIIITRWVTAAPNN